MSNDEEVSNNIISVADPYKTTLFLILDGIVPNLTRKLHKRYRRASIVAEGCIHHLDQR